MFDEAAPVIYQNTCIYVNDNIETSSPLISRLQLLPDPRESDLRLLATDATKYVRTLAVDLDFDFANSGELSFLPSYMLAYCKDLHLLSGLKMLYVSLGPPLQTRRSMMSSERRIWDGVCKARMSIWDHHVWRSMIGVVERSVPAGCEVVWENPHAVDGAPCFFADRRSIRNCVEGILKGVSETRRTT